MSGKTRNKPIIKAGQKNAKAYRPPENPIEFYVSEKAVAYERGKPFIVYYAAPEHSLRLLKGDCIEILNQGFFWPILIFSYHKFNLGNVYGNILAIT